MLITALHASMPAIAQTLTRGKGVPSTTTPKLIIGIAVDQLRTDYLEALEQQFVDGGFKRLMKGGRVYERVIFNLDEPETTTALAVLATGTYPYYNGVPAAQIFDAPMQRLQSVFYDRTYQGINTAGNYSPRALVSTTLADELKTASSRASRIYSIAPDAESALVGAGHTSDCAIWIDDRTGLWATTSYYQSLPSYVNRQNALDPLFFDFRKTNWESLSTRAVRSNLMPYHYETSGFKHAFYQYGKPAYGWFKTSPYVNTAIVELAKLCIRSGFVGMGANTDMLQLTLYAGSYRREQPELYAAELEDTYLRLDGALAELLDYVDRNIGLGNTLIYLTGTGAMNRNGESADGTRLGEFNAHRCTSLLNSHLVARFGVGQWVAGYDQGQIYLDRRAIERGGKDLRAMQEAAADFVAMFSGVEEAVSALQLVRDDASPRVQRVRNGFYRLTGGDIVVRLQPGWTLRADDSSEPQPQTRHDFAPGPAILFAPGRVEARVIESPVDATAIAPTVAEAIRIRAPSGCSVSPLQ